MNDKRLDDLARTIAAVIDGRASRRTVLRALGLGGAATMAGYVGRGRSMAVGAAPARQEAPTPPPRRLPGGPTIEARATDLQYDVERIFRFVADEVAYEAYGGALRGAKGTLWGLAGNSVDQALLLAALLEQALVPTRFAFGELDDDGATKLLESMRLDEATARARDERILGPAELAEGDAAVVELSPEQEAALQTRLDQREATLETARTELTTALRTIEDGLAAADVALPEAAPALPERERTHHVWLQYADGPLWVDLDPSLPDAEPGKAYASLTETVDALPDDLFHTLAVRLVAEVVSGGLPVRTELLAYQARSQDLVGTPLTVLHATPETMKGVGLGISAAIGGTVSYVPNIVVGLAGAYGEPITFGTGEGALDVLGEGTSDGDTLAEWLEIDVLSPDAPPRTIVREIFDRVGSEQRAAGPVDPATVPPAELLDLGADGRHYLPLLAVRSIAVAGQRLPWTYFEQDFAVADPLADIAAVSEGYFHLRDTLALEIANAGGSRFYPDAPNLTVLTLGPTEVTPTEAKLKVEMDILHRSFGFAPYPDEEPASHPLLVAGVLAHVAERVALAAGQERSPDVEVEAIGVGRLFEEAARQGIATRVLSPASPDVADLAVSAQARLRIEEALANGEVVIVPEEAVEIAGERGTGWWQVDPASGRTTDQWETGQGVEFTEEGTMISAGTVRAWPGFFRLGCIVAGLYGFSAGLFIAAGYNSKGGAKAAGAAAGAAGAAGAAAAMPC